MGKNTTWSDLQQIIVQTLLSRREQLLEAASDDQQADFLADHIADDVYAKFDLKPRPQ